MEQRVDLLDGSISKALMKLALPIMGSSFVQMAYNLIDTMWVGRLGSISVAAVGCAGLFMWIAEGISMIPQMGGQILVGQAIGEDRLRKAQSLAWMTIKMVTAMMLFFSVLIWIFHAQFIGFYHLNNVETVQLSNRYLMIVAIGFAPMGYNYTMAGLLTATGDSRNPFIFNLIGMILNIVLDPILIFGVGPFPRWGVAGAAIATAFSQIVVTLLYLNFMRKDRYLFDHRAEEPSNVFPETGAVYLRIGRLGLPLALQSLCFAFITMIISRIIVPFGDSVIAVQQIAGQVESITWMTADGFTVAMNAFVAQNYGAKNGARIRRGFRTAFWMMTALGLATTALLFFGSDTIFGFFVSEAPTIAEGGRFLRIDSIAQVFMCYEMIATGTFSGMGRTKLPSYLSMFLTACRIPLALFLISQLGNVTGVWWAVCITAVLRGVVTLLALILYFRKGITYE